MSEKIHDLEHSTLLQNTITGTVRCKKSGRLISRNNLQCPAPNGCCKYRANCVIYAFGQFEKFDT